jgi:hypothetical protein
MFKAARLIRNCKLFYLKLKLKRKLRKNAKEKIYAMQEMISTEENYVKSLSVIVYRKQHMMDSDMLTNEESMQLFSNIEAIHDIN